MLDNNVIDRHIKQGTRSIKGRKANERLWTVIATCELQGRSAFNFILKAVEDPDVNVRVMAVSYLRNFDDPRVFDVLTASLSDSQKDVRTMAQESLDEYKK